MQELPSNFLFDCALLPPNTIFVHRGDVHETESTSIASIWKYFEVDGKEYTDGLKVKKIANDAINLGAISVYQLECTAHEGHQLSEPTSNGCYMVNLSSLTNFSLSRMLKSVKDIFSKRGLVRL